MADGTTPPTVKVIDGSVAWEFVASSGKGCPSAGDAGWLVCTGDGVAFLGAVAVADGGLGITHTAAAAVESVCSRAGTVLPRLAVETCASWPNRLSSTSCSYDAAGAATEFPTPFCTAQAAHVVDVTSGESSSALWVLGLLFFLFLCLSSLFLLYVLMVRVAFFEVERNSIDGDFASDRKVDESFGDDDDPSATYSENVVVAGTGTTARIDAAFAPLNPLEGTLPVADPYHQNHHHHPASSAGAPPSLAAPVLPTVLRATRSANLPRARRIPPASLSAHLASQQRSARQAPQAQSDHDGSGNGNDDDDAGTASVGNHTTTGRGEEMTTLGPSGTLRFPASVATGSVGGSLSLAQPGEGRGGLTVPATAASLFVLRTLERLDDASAAGSAQRPPPEKIREIIVDAERDNVAYVKYDVPSAYLSHRPPPVPSSSGVVPHAAFSEDVANADALSLPYGPASASSTKVSTKQPSHHRSGGSSSRPVVVAQFNDDDEGGDDGGGGVVGGAYDDASPAYPSPPPGTVASASPSVAGGARRRGGGAARQSDAGTPVAQPLAIAGRSGGEADLTHSVDLLGDLSKAGGGGGADDAHVLRRGSSHHSAAGRSSHGRRRLQRRGSAAGSVFSGGSTAIAVPAPSLRASPSVGGGGGVGSIGRGLDSPLSGVAQTDGYESVASTTSGLETGPTSPKVKSGRVSRPDPLDAPDFTPMTSSPGSSGLDARSPSPPEEAARRTSPVNDRRRFSANLARERDAFVVARSGAAAAANTGNRSGGVAAGLQQPPSTAASGAANSRGATASPPSMFSSVFGAGAVRKSGSTGPTAHASGVSTATARSRRSSLGGAVPAGAAAQRAKPRSIISTASLQRTVSEDVVTARHPQMGGELTRKRGSLGDGDGDGDDEI